MIYPFQRVTLTDSSEWLPYEAGMAPVRTIGTKKLTLECTEGFGFANVDVVEIDGVVFRKEKQ